MSDVVENKEHPIPDWARGRCYGEYLTKGAQLSTKDGRRCGNAFVINPCLKESIPASPNLKPWEGFVRIEPEIEKYLEVLTDAGNYLKLTLGEAKELFHPPEYYVDTRLMEAYLEIYSEGHPIEQAVRLNLGVGVDMDDDKDTSKRDFISFDRFKEIFCHRMAEAVDSMAIKPHPRYLQTLNGKTNDNESKS